MGKAIRNFKDALTGVEEAKYRKIDDQAQTSQPKQAETAASEPKKDSSQT